MVPYFRSLQTLVRTSLGFCALFFIRDNKQRVEHMTDTQPISKINSIYTTFVIIPAFTLSINAIKWAAGEKNLIFLRFRFSYLMGVATCKISFLPCKINSSCDFNLKFIKIHGRRAAGEDILKFTCICVCVCIYVFIYLCICLCHVSWPH